MEKSTGIVIQNCAPHTQKIMLFDKETGNCWATNPKRNLSPGSLICYEKTVGASITFLSSIELLDVPFFWAQEDILFLHHILELCSLFVPMSQPQPELFALLSFLYVNKLENSLSKKIFLCKFFILLGMHPEVDVQQQAAVLAIAQISIDTVCKQGIDLKQQQYLTDWLNRCIEYCAGFGQIKTMHYIKVNNNL